MAFMVRKDTASLLEQVKHICEISGIAFEFPVEIAGEWAGRGIQKGVAVSEVEQFFAIFRVAIGQKETSLKWLPPSAIFGMGLPEQRIFNVLDFGYWYVHIPFNEPEMVQNDLTTLTLQVEAQCPAGKFFGVEGVGEGIVWSPKSIELAQDSGLWFKVKGEKHSVSKVKTTAKLIRYAYRISVSLSSMRSLKTVWSRVWVKWVSTRPRSVSSSVGLAVTSTRKKVMFWKRMP